MKTIRIENVVRPASKFQTLNNITPTNSQGVYNCEVIPGQSIRVFGTMTNHVNGPQQFDKTFKVGDQAEYDSYNLRYVGTIVAIGPKTVTIKHYANSSTVTRLHAYGFIDRNWNFDADKIARENAIESQCI